MFVSEIRNRFEFDDDLSIANKIGLAGSFEDSALVTNLQLWLRDRRDPTVSKLVLQRLMVNGLQKPIPMFVIDFKASSNNLVGFFFI